MLQECLDLEDRLKREEEAGLVKAFVAELERGGRAVAGLADTLRKLNSHEIRHLLVTHNFSKPGLVCPGCHGLFLNEETCPTCKVKTEPVADVVDEAIEIALNKNIPLTQVNPPSRLEHYGNIGGFLKFKTQR